MEQPKNETRDQNGGVEGNGLAAAMQVLTREELAAVLKVSVHTVDRMLADGELPHIRLRGSMIRFYLPDVVRALVATAVTRKRGPGKERA
jgi:excisionase family DNA binding protein